MSANKARHYLSQLIKQDAHANRTLDEKLDDELSNMDPAQGPLNTGEKADNADKIIRDRQRQLANVGFVAAMHPDTARVMINTAHDIINSDKFPAAGDSEAEKTYISAHRMLQSLFRYYSDEDETK